MHARFLMATLRIPVRVGVDGDLILLNEYSKIEIGEMDGPITTKTNETIYSKVIDYLARPREDEEQIKEDEEESREEDPREDDEERVKEEEEEEESREEEEEEPREEEKREPPKYKFPHMKKSKKPVNITFRARNKSQNFTKKVYST